MLDTVRRERRGILDLAFLVASLSLATSILADELRARSVLAAWIVVSISLVALAWRILKSGLFRAGRRSEVDCTIAVDSDGNILSSFDVLSCHWHVQLAMGEFSRRGLAYKQNELGGEEFRSRLRDAVEAGIIGVFETVYRSGWKPLVRRSGHFVLWGHEPADMSVISRDIFPSGLAANPALSHIHALGSAQFCAPPRTTLSYEAATHTIVLENPYVILRIATRSQGANSGLPRPLAENRGQLVLAGASLGTAGATLSVTIEIDAKLKKLRALSSTAEEVAQWAEDVSERVASAVQQDWEAIARQERDIAVIRAAYRSSGDDPSVR